MGMFCRILTVSVIICYTGVVGAFAPTPSSKLGIKTATTTTTIKLVPFVDVNSMIDVTTTTISSSMNLGSSLVAAKLPAAAVAASTTAITGMENGITNSNTLLAFADQGQNLAGIFFQASLIPYLLFLYFLSFRANRIPAIGNFGFQFVLVFVASTIPAGIISKSVYGTSLANVDWLHGGAELLLTVANILIVWGLKEASTKSEQTPVGIPRFVALGLFGLFAASCALGPNTIGFNVHDGFLAGIGDLGVDFVQALPWVSHSEPVNALTIPTWAIHFSSVVEYLIAMELVWRYSEVTGNEKWKGMTFGMLPLHASGICACTYHFFYNPSSLQFIVTMQAGFTCLGNITCMIAAFRIAKESGWKLQEMNPFPKSDSDPTGLVADGIASTALVVREQEESDALLITKVLGFTLLSSYLVKYGSLGLDLPFEPNGAVALAIVLGIPTITAFTYYQRGAGSSGSTSDGESKPLLTFGDSSLSMADVKKYGVSGTVAYVITELAFWIVAFPVAATALYQSTGHWPDVINDTGDRAAVLAFIFAGANVARLFVPVRLGAALALAPWVDENILNNNSDDNNSTIE